MPPPASLLQPRQEERPGAAEVKRSVYAPNQPRTRLPGCGYQVRPADGRAGRLSWRLCLLLWVVGVALSWTFIWLSIRAL